MPGSAAGRQHHGDPIGLRRIGGLAVIVAPGRIRLQDLAIERDGAVERDDHDALQRGDVSLQALDLLIEPARHARWRRQQQFCIHGIELGDDRLAREQQIERLGDAAGGRAPDRGNRRRADRQQDRDRVLFADTLRAEERLGRLDAAHQVIVGDDDGAGIERAAQIDHGVRVGIGERSARDQIENARALRELLPHILFARRLIGRRQPVLEHVSSLIFCSLGRLIVSTAGRAAQERALPMHDRLRDHAVNSLGAVDGLGHA